MRRSDRLGHRGTRDDTPGPPRCDIPLWSAPARYARRYASATGGARCVARCSNRPGGGSTALWLQLHFPESTILPIRIFDRPLASIRAGEERQLRPAVIVYPL